MNEILKQMSVLDLELRHERADILRHLRDEKERQLLIMMLENNINSSRRLRTLKELAIGRMIQSKTDDETDKGIVDHLQKEREHLDSVCDPIWERFEDEVVGRQPLYDEMDVM